MDGPNEPVGGAFKVVDAFANAVTRNGGEVPLLSAGEKRKFEGARVSGVVLEDGQRLGPSTSWRPSRHGETFEQLRRSRPGCQTKNILERLSSTPLSDPYFIAWIVTDVDLPRVGAEPVDMFISSSDDIKVGLALNDPERSFFSIQFPRYHTVNGDPKLHGVQLVAPVSFEHQGNWQTGPKLARGEEYAKMKEAFAQKLLGRARSTSGLNRHIVSLDLATPVTMYRYTLNTAGAPVGWSYASRRRWRQRISFVKGLYGAGHCTGPRAC